MCIVDNRERVETIFNATLPPLPLPPPPYVTAPTAYFLIVLFVGEMYLDAFFAQWSRFGFTASMKNTRSSTADANVDVAHGKFR